MHGYSYLASHDYLPNKHSTYGTLMAKLAFQSAQSIKVLDRDPLLESVTFKSKKCHTGQDDAA